MKIYYDKEVDALDIVFKKGMVAKTKEISPGLLLDVDKKDTPLSLEILDVGRRYQKIDLQDISLKLPSQLSGATK